MNEQKLSEIISEYDYDNYYRSYTGGREKLIVFINYNSFKKIYRDFNFTGFVVTTPMNFNEFIFAGVRVSWSPLVTEENGYIFGRTDLL